MRLFDVWFYEHPGVIALQNLFHSPLLLVLFWAMGTWLWRRRGQTWLFWLMAACLIHTLIDIPLHVDDGPLLLFPLNWQWRFESAVSYWDPAYHGRVWGRFEHALDLVLLIWLAVAYRHELRRWLRRMFGRGIALSLRKMWPVPGAATTWPSSNATAPRNTTLRTRPMTSTPSNGVQPAFD